VRASGTESVETRLSYNLLMKEEPMNPIDGQLTGFSGRQVRCSLIRFSAPPYGLETRVMAAWRAAKSAETGFWDMTLLVRGLIVAG